MNDRDYIPLTGTWRFLPDPHADGERLGFWRDEYSARLWREADVPSCFERCCPGLESYTGICWYRRAFRLPQDWAGRRAVLRFEGVNYRARVWLNGTFLGENRDGFLPFEYEIQSVARWNSENNLVVSVDNAHHEGDVPGMHVGWRSFGGILREVESYATDFLRIDDVRAMAMPCGKGGKMEFRLRLFNARDMRMNTSCEVEVRDSNGKLCAQLRSAPVPMSAGAAAEVTLTGSLAEASAWSPSVPALYQAHARLVADGQTVDEREITFGFRGIEATPEGLRLNGEKIFLTGFNRHEDSPRAAMASDIETAQNDLAAMKEAGANFVRLCHYPHHPAELDLCDRLGLLVFAEIPLYFWTDVAEGRKTNSARAETAARQLERLIARDFNHPSIVFWSVSNETHEEEPEVAKANADLIRTARNLDATRLCVHVSNRWHGRPHFEEDDVICVNAYPSINWQTNGHDPATFNAESSAGWWRTQLDALHRLCPDKPVLVTEFGYCSFEGTYGHAFGEDEHAKVIAAEFAAMDLPYVCGATIWCWADHPWPAGRFLCGLAVSPFGVVSRDRHKLKPFWTARAMFRSKQSLDADANEQIPSRTTDVIMLRPHMNDIPQALFPEGYGIRPMTTDDIGLWTDIQRDAEPYLPIGPKTFRDEFGDDLEALERRCFIVTDPRGLGIGTVSAWYHRDFRGQDFGRIHWLAIRPSCQGKGLGKAALAYAMRRLAQWHERCYLVTSTERLQAIRMYLDFGFTPDLGHPSAHATWSELSTRFKHPALDRLLEGA